MKVFIVTTLAIVVFVLILVGMILLSIKYAPVETFSINKQNKNRSY